MLNYKELKKSIIDTKRLIKGKETSIDSSTLELDTLISKLESMIKDKDSRVAEQEKKEKEEFDRATALPFENKISKIENNKIKAKIERDKRINSITVDKIRAKYKSKINIDSELENCNVVKAEVDKFYGEEFSPIIDACVLENYDTSEKLGDLVPNLRTSMKYLNTDTSVIDKVMDYFSGIGSNSDDIEGDENTEGNIAMLIIPLVMCLVILALSIFLYPVILTSIVACIVINCYRSYILTKCKACSKSLEINASSLSELIEDKVKEKVQRDKNNIEKKYEDYIQRANDKIMELDNACTIEVAKQSKNFIFNPSSVESDFQVNKSSLNNKIAVVKQFLATEEKARDDLISQLNNMKKDLIKSTDMLIDSYMPSSILRNKTLPNDYLIDVANREPVIMPRIKESAIITFDKVEGLYSFLNIIFYQTLLRVRPELVKFNIFDEIHLGELFRAYEDDESVNICVDKESITEEIKSINSDMIRRLSLITGYTNKKGQDSIDVYNEFMRGMDCPQETINFIFYCFPNLESIDFMENNQILLNGYKAGYYEYILVPYTDFIKSKKALDLLDKVGKVYNISSGNINKRAKMFYKEVIESTSKL